jgi:protein translocase SEC61 complex gamma subunit
MKLKIKNQVNEYKRVLKLTQKPNKSQFKTIVLISGLGIAIIGIVGFSISMIKQLLF